MGMMTKPRLATVVSARFLLAILLSRCANSNKKSTSPAGASGPETLAAVRETKSIPLVFAAVYDPAAIGCLARNVTGISSKVPITSLLRYLKKLTPFTRLAIVYAEQEPDSVRQAQELSKLESQYGFRTVKMPVKKIG